MDDLPESLLMDVLLRLPLVALHRFKVVCKKWRSLIFTPYFLGEYNSHSSRGSISPRWAFVSCKEYYCSEIHDDPVEAHELLIDLHSGDLKCPIPNRSNDESGYRIKGVSYGLVLYQWWSAVAWSELGHGVVTSFTVVQYGMELFQFEVFSSETGEWKLSPAYSSPDTLFLQRTPTDFGGILHWVICSHSSGIFAFDPSRNNCRVIPVPAADGPCRHIGMCEPESLGAERGDSWLLQHGAIADILQDVHVEYCDTWEIRGELKLICFHPFDPHVDYLGCHYVFLSYNLREGKSLVLKTFDAFSGDGSWYFKWSRAFCLVIPMIPFVFSPKEPRNESY
ncbi:putative F-box protein At3g28280 [Henckelia pumila]|uniref:putative F-box protein At3g28280 n=1 Tax=Henckelia pumila TaxID=405737 RepID=UPI003C6E0508